MPTYVYMTLNKAGNGVLHNVVHRIVNCILWGFVKLTLNGNTKIEVGESIPY